MFTQFINSLLVVIKFLVFLFYLVNSNTNNVDHITKHGSSNQFNASYNKDLIIVAGGHIAIANCYCCGYGPIKTINILNEPLLLVEGGFFEPGFTVWRYVAHCVHN